MEDYNFEDLSAGRNESSSQEKTAWEDLAATLQTHGLSPKEKISNSEQGLVSSMLSLTSELAVKQAAVQSIEGAMQSAGKQTSSVDTLQQAGRAAVKQAVEMPSAEKALKDIIGAPNQSEKIEELMSDKPDSPLSQFADLGKKSAAELVKEAMSNSALEQIKEIGSQGIRGALRHSSDHQAQAIKALGDTAAGTIASGAIKGLADQLVKHLPDKSVASKIAEALEGIDTKREADDKLKKIEVVNPTEGKTKLSTGDTFIRAGNTEVLVDPKGGTLVVNSDGTFDLDSKGVSRIKHEPSGTTIEYSNGDKVRIENGRIASVERSGQMAVMMNKQAEQKGPWDFRLNPDPGFHKILPEPGLRNPDPGIQLERPEHKWHNSDPEFQKIVPDRKFPNLDLDPTVVPANHSDQSGRKRK